MQDHSTNCHSTKNWLIRKDPLKTADPLQEKYVEILSKADIYLIKQLQKFLNCWYVRFILKVFRKA